MAGVIAFMAFPVFGQDGFSLLPENAGPCTSGSVWVCDFDFQAKGSECVALDIRQHLMPDLGWRCDAPS